MLGFFNLLLNSSLGGSAGAGGEIDGLASDSLVKAHNVLAGGFEVGLGVVGLGDVDLVLVAIAHGLKQILNLAKRLFDRLDEAEGGIQLALWVVSLDGGGKEAEVMALGADLVDIGQAGQVNVVTAIDLTLWDDDLDAVGVARVGDGVIDDGDHPDDTTNGVDLVGEVGRVPNHNGSIGRLSLGFDADCLALFVVENAVNGLVEHVGPTKDGGKASKALRKF